MQSLVLLTIFSTEHVVVFLLVWTCLFWVCCWSDVDLVYHHCCLKCFAQIDFTQLKKQNKNPKPLCGLFKCSRFAKPQVERITTYFFRLIDGSNKQGGSWHLPAAKIVDLCLFACHFAPYSCLFKTGPMVICLLLFRIQDFVQKMHCLIPV